MSRHRSRQRGAAGVEYLAVIGVVALMFGGLLVFRPRTVSRHAPIDVITPIARLLGQPLDPPPPAHAPSTRPRPARPRVPRSRPSLPVMPLPEWWR